MSERNDERLVVQITIALVCFFVLLYSLLVAQNLLVGVAVVLLLFGAYMLWRFLHLAARFVRAIERIAESIETDGT